VITAYAAVASAIATAWSFASGDMIFWGVIGSFVTLCLLGYVVADYAVAGLVHKLYHLSNINRAADRRDL
jgi:hypothetical protein